MAFWWDSLVPGFARCCYGSHMTCAGNQSIYLDTPLFSITSCVDWNLKLFRLYVGCELALNLAQMCSEP